MAYRGLVHVLLARFRLQVMLNSTLSLTTRQTTRQYMSLRAGHLMLVNETVKRGACGAQEATSFQPVSCTLIGHHIDTPNPDGDVPCTLLLPGALLIYSFPLSPATPRLYICEHGTRHP